MTLRAPFKCILAAGLALTLTACAAQPTVPVGPAPTVSSTVPAPQVTPAQPFTFTLAACPAESFHPAVSTSRVNLTLAPLMYEGLFELDNTFTPQSVLCRNYTVSPDGLVWTFTLRDEVTFSDDTPLTAALAAQALNLARTQSTLYSGRFTDMDSIQADREGRLVITLLAPNNALPALLDIPIALSGEDRPLGTGPYVLSAGEGDTLSLCARPDWWRDKPLPEQTIPLAPITQTEDLIHGFDSGLISLVAVDPTGTGALGYSAPCDTVEHTTTGLVYLAFNTGKSSVFRSTAARVAVSAAVERQPLAESAYGGLADAASLPLHPDAALYDEALADSLRPEQSARDLMDQCKLTGRTVTLVVNSENDCKVQAAQLIAQQLEQAGLTVELRILSWSAYTAALAGGQFDLYLAQVNLTADFDLTALLSSDAPLNYGGWANEDTDLLLQTLRSAPAYSRKTAANALYTHLAQEAPLVPLLFSRSCVLTQWGRLTGLSPTRANIFYQFDQWVLKK